MIYQIELYHGQLFQKVDDICSELERQFAAYLNWRATRQGKFILMLDEKEFPWEDVPFIFSLRHDRPIAHIVPNPSASPEKEKSSEYFIRLDILAAEDFIFKVTGERMVRPYAVRRWLKQKIIKPLKA